jgi:hypothetical protein
MVRRGSSLSKLPSLHTSQAVVPLSALAFVTTRISHKFISDPAGSEEECAIAGLVHKAGVVGRKGACIHIGHGSEINAVLLYAAAVRYRVMYDEGSPARPLRPL